jgi:hypothetical protein
MSVPEVTSHNMIRPSANVNVENVTTSKTQLSAPSLIRSALICWTGKWRAPRPYAELPAYPFTQGHLTVTLQLHIWSDTSRLYISSLLPKPVKGLITVNLKKYPVNNVTSIFYHYHVEKFCSI